MRETVGRVSAGPRGASAPGSRSGVTVAGRYVLSGTDPSGGPGLHRAFDLILVRTVLLVVAAVAGQREQRLALDRLRELQASGWAGMPHLYDAGVGAGTVRAVLQPVPGSLLRDAPSREPRQAVGVVTTLLAAVAELHDLGQVHGSISESSVMVGDDGMSVLPLSVDGPRFGKAPEDDVRDALIMLGRLVGGAHASAEALDLVALAADPDATLPSAREAAAWLRTAVDDTGRPTPTVPLVAPPAQSPSAQRAPAPGPEAASEYLRRMSAGGPLERPRLVHRDARPLVAAGASGMPAQSNARRRQLVRAAAFVWTATFAGALLGWLLWWYTTAR